MLRKFDEPAANPPPTLQINLRVMVSFNQAHDYE